MQRKILLLVCLIPATLAAQPAVYAGAAGGLATLSGDGSAIVTATSASTSLLAPNNGPAARLFAGVHLFRYVSFQGDYGWTRNRVTLVSTTAAAGSSSYYRVPETVTQHALLMSALIYFRDRRSRLRPYVSEGAGAVMIHADRAPGALAAGGLPLPPASLRHASIALRTEVGLDVRLRGSWFFRYSFGETLTRNTLGDALTPPQHRIPKDFQNLFGIVYRFGGR